MTPFSGAFLIDKPAGLTSSDVVIKLKIALTKNEYVTRGFKIGHGGTLDPFATGVMMVLVGEATKLADTYLHSQKAYTGLIALGYETDTGDGTGTRVDREGANLDDQDKHVSAPSLTTTDWQALANTFTRDEYLQIPPMYSAKKQAGIALHQLARQGIEVERKAILKKIYQFEIENSTSSQIPLNELSFLVTCESGTYVRVLAEDLAKKAGIRAHLKTLRRVRSSDAKIEMTLPLDAVLEALSLKTPLNKISAFKTLDQIATHVPTFQMDTATFQKVREGKTQVIHELCQLAHQTIQGSDMLNVRFCLARTAEGLPVAIFEKLENGTFRLQRVLNSTYI